MFNARTRFSVIAPLLLVIALSTTAFADVIRLKDGSILKGRIVSFTGGKFTIAIGEGPRSRQMSFTAAEIESIIFDPPNAAAVATTRQADYKKPAENPRVIVSEENRSPETKPEPRRPEPLPSSTEKSAPAASVPGNAIAWNVKVLSDNTSNGWTNTGWVVKKGQKIRITAGDGKVSLGSGKQTEASGSPDISDANKLMKNVPTGALIAVIGDDNNDFIYVGSSREITAARDGALFLGINEGNLDDNAGSLDVKIEIVP